MARVFVRINDEASACLGKVAYDSRADAGRAAGHIQGSKRPDAYKCPHCGKWHVGRPRRQGKINRRMKLI